MNKKTVPVKVRIGVYQSITKEFLEDRPEALKELNQNVLKELDNLRPPGRKFGPIKVVVGESGDDFVRNEISVIAKQDGIKTRRVFLKPFSRHRNKLKNSDRRKALNKYSY